MDVYDIYKVGAKCEYLRQCSPNVWREAEIVDVSYKNGITVKTDTGHISTHPVEHVRLIAPAIISPTPRALDAPKVFRCTCGSTDGCHTNDCELFTSARQ